MEYVAGPDLAVRVRERGTAGPDEAARLGQEMRAPCPRDTATECYTAT